MHFFVEVLAMALAIILTVCLLDFLFNFICAGGGNAMQQLLVFPANKRAAVHFFYLGFFSKCLPSPGSF